MTDDNQLAANCAGSNKRRFAFQFTLRHLTIASAIVALLCSTILWLDLNSADRRIRRLSQTKDGDVTALTFARQSLFAEEPMVCLAAAEAIGKIGPAAQPALDELIYVLNTDLKASPNAAWAIGRLRSTNPKAVEALVDALESTNHETRRYAAFAISLYGFQARIAIPSLERHLDDYNSAYMGARALGEMGQFAPSTSIAKLSAMLAREEPGERAEACKALAKLSAWHSLDQKTLTAIEGLSEDNVDWVRRFAREAIEEIRFNLQNPITE